MIEITESAMMVDPATSMEPVLDELHERGCASRSTTSGAATPRSRA
jgi:hypothetical protein